MISKQLNLLTVDLEEWFVVEALQGRFTFKDWPDLPSTIARNTRKLLSIFDQHSVRATWFILGWCAERHPELIREIVAAGHEVACHSYSHTMVSKMNPEQFRSDTSKAIEIISRAGGITLKGYRAPTWSITDEQAWAFEILAELGFEYDSSIFPIKHDIYGMPKGPTDTFRMSFEDNKYLWEVPASTLRFMGRNIPLGGGGYLRHSPYWYTRWCIKKLNKQGRPAIVYMHPWEVDENLPRVEGLSARQQFRTYGSTDTFKIKLNKLLSEFRFTGMYEYLKASSMRKIGFDRS